MVLARKGVHRSPMKGRGVGSPQLNHSIRSTGGLRGSARNLSKPATSGSGTNVKVVVRVRPPNTKELQTNAKVAVKVIDEKMLIFDPKEEEEASFFFRGNQQKGRDMLKRQHKNTQFLFDRVFGNESTNQQVFEESTKDIISHVLEGYNCSVFVYGATGAGKTFTMLGTESNPGVMFLTMVHLFEQMEALKPERDFEMAVSYLEVYNECVHDLIAKSAPLYLREDSNGVFVSGLKIERITSTNRLFELLAEGNKNRTQHPTDANAESSRSHAVFQVYLKMTTKGTNQKKMVKLSMIDLAGSERGSATNFAGARFKEGSSINKSLLALGNCINKLADGLPHIPYRDSKLTRILKDSLSGNCRTVMIANVSPSSLSFEDTHNTLRYAKRAKMIKSVVKKNIVSVEMHVSHYVKMVDDLKEENARLKAELEKAEAALAASKAANAANPVYLTPVKIAPTETKISPKPQKEVLSALLKEAEKVFAEKEDLQKRYLQMDSNEKVIMFRMQCKERSVARVQQLCETPTNTDEAKFRAGRSLKQFTGQLKSAVGCQEGLASERKELDTKLESLRQEAAALGFLEEFNDKTDKMDIRFQNVELKEQLAHLNKVMVLLNKEKDDQDQVMSELSSAFRHYFNLLRGHGHMTDSMLKEHRSIARRLEGLKTVNWEEETDSSPLKSFKTISKLSLSDSPVVLRCPSPIAVTPVQNEMPLPGEEVQTGSSPFDVEKIKLQFDLLPITSQFPSNLQIDQEKPALIDDSDEEDFCVSGKFAQFNATFERLPATPFSEKVDKMDATLTKVQNLLNESSSVGPSPLDLTFDKSPLEFNKTYDAVTNAETMNRTYEVDEPPAEMKAADELTPLELPTVPKLSPKSASVDMNSTYQVPLESEKLPVPHAATATTTAPTLTSAPSGTTNKLKTSSTALTNGSLAKRPKGVVPKKPLQENNFVRPKVISQNPAYKWKPTLLKAPTAANAKCMSLERKFPLSTHVKPKVLLGNKENGSLRKPITSTIKTPPSGSVSRATNADAK